jgi:hypothetical protein
VFEPDEGWTPQEPLLRFVRAGSVSSPATTLYVLVPRDWTVEPVSEGAVTEIEDVPALSRKLARLTGAAYFISSDNESVRFKVEPDSDERELKLELTPFTPFVPIDFVLANDACELVASPTLPLVHEVKKQPRSPTTNELFVRRPGGKWTPLVGPLSGAGLMELSWRDTIANIQIEKRTLALVPNDARIIGRMKDALSGEVRLQGLPGWTATVRESACAVDAGGDTVLSIRFTGRPVYRLPMTIRPPGGQSFDVIVPLIGRDAVFALADGTIIEAGKQIDVGALRGAVAVAPRKTVIHLTAKGSKSAGVRALIERELPLGTLRSAIDEMLAIQSGQDDLVELYFLGDPRLPIRVSRYRNKQLTHEGTFVRWLPRQERSSVLPVARMILDPRHEHALVPQGDGAWRLPDRCEGPCLVYLRDGVDVYSRPLPVVQPGSPHTHAGVLISALAIPDFEERQTAIREALIRVGRNAAGTDDLKWLLDAATNLNGLPASAFDALKLLPSCPEALIHLLLNARDAGERGMIWALQNELSFLWLALPLKVWRSAIGRQWDSITNALESALGKERAINDALTWLRGLCGDLTALEPALDAVFGMAGIPIAQATDMPSLRDLTSGYVQEQHQRGGEPLNDLAERLASAGLRLPDEIETKSHANFAGLFAPVLLAGSACEKLVLDRELALIARRTLREDAKYISGAWRHLVKFYG